MTPRQAQLLAFLTERQRAGGAMPSYVEMAASLGIRSKSGVSRIIDALVELGRIRRTPGHFRSIEVVEQGFHLDQNIEDALRSYAHVTGMPRSAIMAAALREYFRLHPIPPPAGDDR